MPRPKRQMRRASIFLPATLEETIAQLSAARTERQGFAPLMADMMREAMIRGAAILMEEDAAIPKRTGASKAFPKRGTSDKKGRRVR